ncbi:hypothetical protein PG993_011094 [Apiospora rasikravindrae]|uniref:Apple domain-containing protein n=1 Tax=Apiospora rasikravindrae TaxID=990691 RepID=A0ABR1SET1_9PEZI
MRPTIILFVLNLAVAMAAGGGSRENDACVNGTTVGSIQKFQVYCSSTARGRRTTSVDVPTLDDCADACARANPRCTAATFDGKSCAFHNETESVPSRLAAPDPSPKFTAVVGLPTSSSSNCRAITQATTMQTINEVQFALSCGTNTGSDSLSNHFASSLQDCMGQCAQTSMCKAVSFNADQTLGFQVIRRSHKPLYCVPPLLIYMSQNCFLKSAAKSELSVAPLLDTAMVVRPQDEEDDGLVSDKTAQTNTMIIIAVSVSGFAFLFSLGLLCWWVHRRRTKQKRFRSLPVGVVPVSYRDRIRMDKDRMDRDRMDEKYGVRTSVAWSAMSRDSLLSGKTEVPVGKPTPVYEIRRKGEYY